MKVFTLSLLFFVMHSSGLRLMAFHLLLFSLFLPSTSFSSGFIPIQTPSTGYQPQFQVASDKVYYVWHEYGPYRQIFTAEMNIDGTGWREEKRTCGRYDKVFPQLRVVGDRIYYVRQQPDAAKHRQIWTMEMNVDGSGWKEVQRTNTPFDKQFPQIRVVGSRIHYAWNESDGNCRQIWTAGMNVDGAGWQATKRTSTPFDKLEPQVQVAGDKIYFVWREFDGSHFQIWTAMMKRDGSTWEGVKRTSSPFDKHNIQFHVSGGRIHFTWHEADGPDWRRARYQIWTAVMNVDGTGWRATQRTTSPLDKYTPQLQVHGENIYYVWEESDGRYRQIWTAVTDKAEGKWRSEKRTDSPYGKYDPQFQIVGNRAYYVWHEDHGLTEPIWIAMESLMR